MSKFMSKNGYESRKRYKYIYAVYNAQKIVDYSQIQALLPIRVFRRRKRARKFVAK